MVKMTRLTDRRRKKAESILERYRVELYAEGSVDPRAFDRELTRCLKLHYVEMKDIFQDLAKIERYRPLAAYYMQHSNSGMPVQEYWSALEKVYGSRIGDQQSVRKEKQDEYWRNFEAERQTVAEG